MGKKMMAVFLMCIVAVAGLRCSSANADEMEAKFDAKFKSCYETCERECLHQGSTRSFCEVKCDEDCTQKEVADKLHIHLAHL